MRTVVLPPAAAAVRAQAAEFMSRRFRAFCRQQGVPHRAGFALWGPPGCGKTSFVTALAAELGASLYVLTLDPTRMTDDGLKYLMRSVSTTGRSVVRPPARAAATQRLPPHMLSTATAMKAKARACANFIQKN